MKGGITKRRLFISIPNWLIHIRRALTDNYRIKLIDSFFDAFLQRICSLDSGLFITFLRKKGITIGDGTYFFGRVYIDTTRPVLVEIGKNCVFTNHVSLLTHGYDWSVLRLKYGEMLCSSGKVIIEDNVFIGTGAIILKGVRVGRDSIIGAGSVVTHNIPPGSVAVGNPCAVIMSVDEYYQRRKARYINEAQAYAYELFLKTARVPKEQLFGEELPIFSNHFGSAPIFPSFKDFLESSGVSEIEANSI